LAAGAYVYLGNAPADFTVIAGKKFLVTGGGSGIGEELAVFITSWGGDVTITGRTEAKLVR
jgi:short-subunit dehydrogenase involved in D-alanine esterification of teichoic acids